MTNNNLRGNYSVPTLDNYAYLQYDNKILKVFCFHNAMIAALGTSTPILLHECVTLEFSQAKNYANLLVSYFSG